MYNLDGQMKRLIHSILQRMSIRIITVIEMTEKNHCLKHIKDA